MKTINIWNAEQLMEISAEGFVGEHQKIDVISPIPGMQGKVMLVKLPSKQIGYLIGNNPSSTEKQTFLAFKWKGEGIVVPCEKWEAGTSKKNAKKIGNLVKDLLDETN